KVSEALFYGLEDEAFGLQEMQQTSESKNCRRCGYPYEYQLYYYAHLGKYHCPQCGGRRPQPLVYVDKVLAQDESGSTIHLVTPVGEAELRLQVPGLYNIYNALAATAGAVAMGRSFASIRAGLEDTIPSFGRMERLDIQGRQVTLALVKNPAGFNEVIRTILSGTRGKHLVICINDLYFDGTDISWLWDVDFEQLAAQQDEIPFIICSGLRAEDMAVRLKYAGIDVKKLKIANDLKQALDLALSQVSEGELLHILPTYTAMLNMREILHKQGLVQAFWEV
ncbi:MAG TPA: MurT ligase domain-containing protein, partial [Candidatus Caenarcaniphilales bacterium]